MRFRWPSFRRRRAERFAAATAPMSDEDFLRALPPNDADPAHLLALRHTVARLCNLPPDRLRPHHDPTVLANLISCDFDSGWDELGFTLHLEFYNDLRVPAGEQFIPLVAATAGMIGDLVAPVSFGEWVIQNAAVLTRRLDPSVPPPPTPPRRHPVYSWAIALAAVFHFFIAPGLILRASAPILNRTAIPSFTGVTARFGISYKDGRAIFGGLFALGFIAFWYVLIPALVARARRAHLPPAGRGFTLGPSPLSQSVRPVTSGTLEEGSHA